MICRSKVNRGNYFKYQDIYLKTLKYLVNMRRVSIYFLILFSCLFVCFCSVSVFLRILYKGKHLLNKCITRYTIATTIWHWLKISNTFRGNLFNENLETIPRRISYYNHFVTSVQIRSFFWSLFPSIRTEYGDLLLKSPYSVKICENMDQKKNTYLDKFQAINFLPILPFILILSSNIQQLLHNPIVPGVHWKVTHT